MDAAYPPGQLGTAPRDGTKRRAGRLELIALLNRQQLISDMGLETDAG